MIVEMNLEHVEQLNVPINQSARKLPLITTLSYDIVINLGGRNNVSYITCIRREYALISLSIAVMHFPLIFAAVD
jgi:hypothetical protein